MSHDQIPADGAQAEPPFPSATVAWTAVAILVVMAILSLLDRQILSLMINMIRADLKVTDTQMGLLQGVVFSLVYCIAAFPFGWAVDRYSRRWTLFFGVFAWAIAATACGLAFSFNTLLAARLGVGLGEAALMPVVASMLSDLFPKKRIATAFAVVSVGMSIGTQGALIIGGAVLYWAGDGMTLPLLGFLSPWKLAFIVTGVPGLLLAFSIFLIPEPVRRRSRLETSAVGAETWGDTMPFLKRNCAYLICYIGGFASLSVATTAQMLWGPTVLQRIYGMAPAKSGIVLGVFSLACALVGTMATGFVADKFYAKGSKGAYAIIYAVTGLVVGAVGLATMWAGSAWIYVAILGPAKLVSNFAGVAQAGLQTITPSHLRGRMAALFNAVATTSGAIIGASVVPFFTDVVFKDDKKVAWSLGASMLLFGVLTAVLLWMAQRILKRTPALEAD
jgi:MFS family permease